MENRITELEKEVEFLKEEQKDAFALLSTQSVIINLLSSLCLTIEQKRGLAEQLRLQLPSPAEVEDREGWYKASLVHLRSFVEHLEQGLKSPE